MLLYLAALADVLLVPQPAHLALDVVRLKDAPLLQLLLNMSLVTQDSVYVALQVLHEVLTSAKHRIIEGRVLKGLAVLKMH